MNPELELMKAELADLKEKFERLQKSDRYVFERDLELQTGRNIQLATDTGTKIGTGIDQKLGFYGETPKVQATVANTSNAAFTEDSGTTVNVESTFGGWRIKEVVQALINIGILDGTAD